MRASEREREKEKRERGVWDAYRDGAHTRTHTETRTHAPGVLRFP